MTKADQILESAQSSGGFLRPVRLQFSLAIHQVTPGGKSDAFCALPACSTFDDLPFVRSPFAIAAPCFYCFEVTRKNFLIDV